MPVYNVPSERYFRIHHVRPRFKNDIEQVLLYMATEIRAIGRKPKEDFVIELNNAIRRYPGNLYKKQKTIDNWRTEISALFGLIVDEGDFLAPSNRAVEFAEAQDLTKFLKLFCYYFQYPGGFLKPHENLKFLKAGVNFRPASYILRMLHTAEDLHGRRAGINKAEATHCIFNDLGVTRDARPVEDTWGLIEYNRHNNFEYDWNGDVIRYAGDILDYMTQANLLKLNLDGKFYINHLEDIAIERYYNPADFFDYYSMLPDPSNVTLEDVKLLNTEWIDYFTTPKDESFFTTDVLALVSKDKEQYDQIKDVIASLKEIVESEVPTAGSIGSIGESLVLNHEIIRITEEGRPDLRSRIKLIPAVYAVGYDINSVEVDTRKRMIEVKTTASTKTVDFVRFHMTTNEWEAANTHRDRYFVYRLMISKKKIRLFLIQDPVGEYKCDKLNASPRNGMDVYFDPAKCGITAELLM